MRDRVSFLLYFLDSWTHRRDIYKFFWNIDEITGLYMILLIIIGYDVFNRFRYLVFRFNGLLRFINIHLRSSKTISKCPTGWILTDLILIKLPPKNITLSLKYEA